MYVVNAILIVLVIYLAAVVRSYRRRLHIAKAGDQGYAIPTMSLAEFDGRFRLGPCGPGPDAEVLFIGGADKVKGGVTDREAWILSVLAKDSRRSFEFGTATGKTAYLLARNSPPGACVITITLPPDAVGEYHHEDGDSVKAHRTAIEESTFCNFLYEGTAVASKITQLFGDSKALDVCAYRASCDLIFIDGSHAYSYVLSDSRKAFQMVSPRGMILWHDYRKGVKATRDVVRALDAISRERRLVRLAGTHLVAYRAEWGTAQGAQRT